jgi:nucleotide-binding universal stress UspA family protein
LNAYASTVDGILVPLDGSEFSARAVPVAVRRAALLDATVHLLPVVAVPSSEAEEACDGVHRRVAGSRAAHAV